MGLRRTTSDENALDPSPPTPLPYRGEGRGKFPFKALAPVKGERVARSAG